MKRVWFAAALMLLLGLGGIAVTMRVGYICRPIAACLEQAETASAEEAARLCADARKGWEQNRKFVASVTDHEPMEEVDALFDALLDAAGDAEGHADDGLRLREQAAGIHVRRRALEAVHAADAAQIRSGSDGNLFDHFTGQQNNSSPVIVLVGIL